MIDSFLLVAIWLTFQFHGTQRTLVAYDVADFRHCTYNINIICASSSRLYVLLNRFLISSPSVSRLLRIIVQSTPATSYSRDRVTVSAVSLARPPTQTIDRMDPEKKED
jgi:hypothetical protein